MQKVVFTNKPGPLAIELGYSIPEQHYTVAANIVELPENQGYSADVNSFWELPGKLDEADMKAHPENYLYYIPKKDKDIIQKRYSSYVQRWMDSTVQQRNYDDIFTAVTYSTSIIPEYKAEGIACKDWRDTVWAALYSYLDKVFAGQEELVELEHITEKLPQLVWPN